MAACSRLGIDSPGQRAPARSTCEWFTTDRALQLTGLRGKVVVLHAVQILCPARVHHGLPQAQRISASFAPGTSRSSAYTRFSNTTLR